MSNDENRDISTWIHRLDTANPPKVILLTKASSKMLRYRVTDAPAGRSIAKSYWMLKRSWLDPDGEALLAKTITSAESINGQIQPGSATANAFLEFAILADDLADAEGGEYVCGVKSILDDGAAYVHAHSVTLVHVLDPAVEAVS